MRQLFVAVSLVAVIATCAYAQEPSHKPYASRVSISAPLDSIEPAGCYLVDQGQLVRVEEAPVQRGGGGTFATKLWFDLQGETSELKISSSRPRFRIMADRAMVLSLRLGHFDVKDGKRRAQLTGWNKADFFKKTLALIIEKAQDGVYDLVPAEPLEPGEYCISGYPGTPVADFTIQPLEAKPGK